MARLKNPSHEDIFYARTEAPKAAAAVGRAAADAAAALRQIAAQDYATPAEVVAAVGKFRAGQVAIDAAMFELLGLAVLGGAPITTTARDLGMRPGTLGQRLTSTSAAKRGERR
ncbi:hypothetical protein [Mycobacterium sp. SMC-19]|uniref:hypothetical protein n=1 Tax=Mycobacterium sp. SMC-19 TaxID=3381630 RepID=UPI0038777604